LELDARAWRIVVAVLRKRRQRISQIARRLNAIRGALRHQLFDQARQSGWHIPAKVCERRRLMPALFVELGEQTAAGKRHLPGEQEIERATETIQVGANVGAVRVLEL